MSTITVPIMNDNIGLYMLDIDQVRKSKSKAVLITAGVTISLSKKDAIELLKTDMYVAHQLLLKGSGTIGKILIRNEKE